MQRVHLLSPNNKADLAISRSHAAIQFYFDEPGYKDFFLEKHDRDEVHAILSAYSQSKSSIGYIVDEAESVGADYIWLLGAGGVSKKRADFLENLTKAADTEIVAVMLPANERTMVAEYRFLIENTSVSPGMPCISSEYGNGFGRFKFIYDLVMENTWSLRRQHFLWELENPAELAIYSKTFTSAVRQSIAGFASERCFIDSAHGIRYNGSRGLIGPTPKGVELAQGYTNDYQHTVFSENDMTIRGFISGSLGDDLVTEMEEWLHVEIETDRFDSVPAW